MIEKQHDLFDFFQTANKQIESEYKRISRSVREDPGTAGDQGELNWKNLIEQWLPPYFQVVTKGRIINEKNESSPQLDIIILSPEYPKALVNCNRYLSKGVVAAFECKTTLRKIDIKDFFEHSKILQSIIGADEGSPRKDLYGRITYGLLAHSHEWKKESSTPKENISKTIEECFWSMTQHPREMPDLLCVADIGVWRSFKMIIPPQLKIIKNNIVNNQKNYLDRLTVRSGYFESTSNSAIYTPVGAMIFDMLDMIAWNYPRMRNICDYMRKLGVEGSGAGNMRIWEPDVVLSKSVLKNIHKLKNGGFWNEWGMLIM